MENGAIVTGSSSGFGLATSIELAKCGYNVLATMRNMEKASLLMDKAEKEGMAGRIFPFHLDVTKEDSIEALRVHLEEWNRIDVLINNAGFALAGFAEELNAEDYRRQFETNVFGVISVTNAVLPKMREQKSGKIINVSSISGGMGFPGLSAYTSSKYALEGYTESLRLEIGPFGIDAALVEPGSYQTNIWSKSMEEINQSKSSSVYESYKEKVITAMESNKQNQRDPFEVARLIVYLAEKERLSNLRYPIGKGTRFMLNLKKVLPWNVWEKLVLQQIFK